LLEKYRESWNAVGRATDYDAILRRIDDTEPFGPLVDPDDEAFGIEGDMPEKIRTYCRRTGQTPSESVDETARCILESLAVRTAVVLEQLSAVTGDASDRIHLGGGGVRNPRFCQMLADATGMPVVAGPVEATSVGNLLSQAAARGDLPTAVSFDAPPRPGEGPECRMRGLQVGVEALVESVRTALRTDIDLPALREAFLALPEEPLDVLQLSFAGPPVDLLLEGQPSCRAGTFERRPDAADLLTDRPDPFEFGIEHVVELPPSVGRVARRDQHLRFGPCVIRSSDRSIPATDGANSASRCSARESP